MANKLPKHMDRVHYGAAVYAAYGIPLLVGIITFERKNLNF